MDFTAFDLAQMFASIAHDLAEQPTLTATLEQTVTLAVDAVPGCDIAGVSWMRRDLGIETPVSTDPVVEKCDAAQYEYNEGPCIDAAWEGEVYVVDDMQTEPRWPKFAARAAELGVGSMLACQLAAPQGVVGALNLYSWQAAAFDVESQQIATIYAAHASIALANQRMENDLRRAYESRGIIGQAIGVMVERHRVTPAVGFEMLVRASQSKHVKLRELARYVIETGVDPAAVQVDGGQIVDA